MEDLFQALDLLLGLLMVLAQNLDHLRIAFVALQLALHHLLRLLLQRERVLERRDVNVLKHIGRGPCAGRPSRAAASHTRTPSLTCDHLSTVNGGPSKSVP